MDEAQIAALVVAGIKAGLAPLVADMKALQAQCAGWEARWSDVGALRERMAVVEAREAIPGPMGPAGEPGAKGDAGERGERGAEGASGAQGLQGKDGLDGMGFDDLEMDYDGDRCFVLRLTQGDRVKEKSFTVPVMLYKGVYVHGKAYEAGDTVSYSGATWVAKANTAETPGDGATNWQLAVKTGREGKPGKPGKDGKDGLNGKDGKDLAGTGWSRG